MTVALAVLALVMGTAAFLGVLVGTLLWFEYGERIGGFVGLLAGTHRLAIVPRAGARSAPAQPLPSVAQRQADAVALRTPSRRPYGRLDPVPGYAAEHPPRRRAYEDHAHVFAATTPRPAPRRGTVESVPMLVGQGMTGPSQQGLRRSTIRPPG